MLPNAVCDFDTLATFFQIQALAKLSPSMDSIYVHIATAVAWGIPLPPVVKRLTCRLGSKIFTFWHIPNLTVNLGHQAGDERSGLSFRANQGHFVGF